MLKDCKRMLKKRKDMPKRIFAVSMAVVLTVAGLSYTPSTTAKASVTSSQGSSSWSLVWSDEFDQMVGGSPDTSIWNYDTGATGWGNNEVQNYTSSTDNVYIADLSSDSGSTDGKALALKAIKSGSEITSGRIHTQNNQYLTYGRIECKMRVENGSQSGVWPAFWMLGENYSTSSSNYNGANGSSPWPACGELDIMEHRNTEQQVIGTLHWNTSLSSYAWTYQGSETTGSYGYIDSIESWHTYAVEWYEDVIKWYVDGSCYQTISISSDEMDEFQRDFFIIFDLAIGSTSTPFTQYQTVSNSFTSATMYVDYVRVYQGTDSNFSIAQTSDTSKVIEDTSESDGYTTCVTDATTNVGEWNYYVGSWAGAAAQYKGGTTLDDFSLKVTASNSTSWGLQASTNVLSVEAGKTYSYSITLNSDTAGAGVLLKDEISGTDLNTVTLSEGDNVFSGTFTAAGDTMQFMYDLGALTAGTTVSVTAFSLEEVSDSSGSDSGSSQGDSSSDTGAYNWVSIGNGTGNSAYDGLYYRDDTSVSVVNAQTSGDNTGVYLTVADGILSVSVNGVTNSNYYAIQGAGTWVSVLGLTENINEVVITHAGGTSTIYIKNTNVSESEDVTTEETTKAAEEETTKSTTEETTKAAKEETTASTTKEEGEGEGEGWTAWTSSGSYNWTPLSSYDSGWTLSDQNIGTVWWSIQTQSPQATLTAGETYQVSFTLTAPYPKAFTVDATKDNYVFTETGNGGWTQNSDKTYSYNYVGTYTAVEDGTNVRISLGYDSENDSTYYSENGSYTFALSDYSIDIDAKDTVTISDDIDITGYQMTASLNGVDGSMGMRVVYQAEDTIESQMAAEIGLVYGLVYGDDPITADDVLYGSDNTYVASYAATEAGVASQILGDSQTATYYVRTMSCASTDEDISISTDAYTSTYYVRAYAILKDGSVVYSDVATYTIYDIADYIYQNVLVSNYSTYYNLYTKILCYVNPDYKEGDYDWGTTVVNP